MTTTKRLLAPLLLGLTAIYAFAADAAPPPEPEAIAGTRMRVDWQALIARNNIELPKLPASHTDSLRLGNGDIGVAVYAVPECLVLFVGKNDLLDYRTKPLALSPEATAISNADTPMPTTKPAGWIRFREATPRNPDAELLFVRRIVPFFAEKCMACHGNDPAKLKGGLDMRTLASTLKGGDSEKPGLISGKPEESPLYLAVTRKHDAWEPMPPKEADKLYAEQMAWIKDWIAGGAPWLDEARQTQIAKANEAKWSAEDGITVKTTGALSPEWANRKYKPEGLWAYQPVRQIGVMEYWSDAVSNTRARHKSIPPPHPIDTLIAAKMPAGLKPAPAADARTLIRRASFDLTGLPPTPEEVAAFESSYSKDANAAVTTLIERLLDSPHYGERMAQHWLDVTRYADSSGFSNDYERGNAWRYRDYVVRAFNGDKPYDQFIKEQIAGDEIDANDPEKVIATGFLRTGPWELTGMEVEKIARQRFLDDVTSSVGENRTLGGIPNRPEINLEAALQPRQVMGTFAAAWTPNPLPSQRHRRSLYALKIRGLPDTLQEVFNAPAPDFSCERRDASTVTPQVFSLFNGQSTQSRALALAHRAAKETRSDKEAIARIFALTFSRPPNAEETQNCLAHWRDIEDLLGNEKPASQKPPLEVRRDAVEENTGEKFSFSEKLHAYADFVPDLQPADVPSHTRALADVCLALLNSNEFAYVY